jgi:hypothetical protein
LFTGRWWFVLVGKMTHKVHLIMENSSNFDLTILANSV